jgi:hypothetical protein
LNGSAQNLAHIPEMPGGRYNDAAQIEEHSFRSAAVNYLRTLVATVDFEYAETKLIKGVRYKRREMVATWT